MQLEFHCNTKLIETQPKQYMASLPWARPSIFFISSYKIVGYVWIGTISGLLWGNFHLFCCLNLERCTVPHYHAHQVIHKATN